MQAESVPLEIPVHIRNAPNCISHSQKLEKALDMIMHNSDEDLQSDESEESLPSAYLSTTYYKNKNFFIESQSLSKEDKVLLPFAGL
jgi:hypothetical protein